MIPDDDIDVLRSRNELICSEVQLLNEAEEKGTRLYKPKIHA